MMAISSSNRAHARAKCSTNEIHAPEYGHWRPVDLQPLYYNGQDIGPVIFST